MEKVWTWLQLETFCENHNLFIAFMFVSAAFVCLFEGFLEEQIILFFRIFSFTPAFAGRHLSSTRSCYFNQWFSRIARL